MPKIQKNFILPTSTIYVGSATAGIDILLDFPTGIKIETRKNDDGIRVDKQGPFSIEALSIDPEARLVHFGFSEPVAFNGIMMVHLSVCYDPTATKPLAKFLEMVNQRNFGDKLNLATIPQVHSW